MTFSHGNTRPTGTPTLPPSTGTSWSERRTIALSLLGHHEPGPGLCRLVIAAMEGASLLELASLDTQAVNA